MSNRRAARAAIERMLAEACETLGLASQSRCMPFPVSRKPVSGRPPPRRALERLSRAFILIAGADLTAEQRDLLWKRAQGIPLKTLAHEIGVAVSVVTERHDEALSALLARAWATKQWPRSPKATVAK